jgi:hypothetical protein
MVKREIVWTRNSQIQLHNIFNFYNQRNKSISYSKKLYQKFKVDLNATTQNPEIGVKTKLKNIRGLIVENFILYYEILPDKIMVLKVWDCRQNPEKLRYNR